MVAPVHGALDGIDRFVELGTEIARMPILATPDYRLAVQDLFVISQKLLLANEHMARWLHRFRYFDFDDDQARAKFLSLAMEYSTAKTGPEFHRMKFSCSDIGIIFSRNIAGKLDEMYPQDSQAAADARSAFQDLAAADASMVAFIHGVVVAGIDDFIRKVEKCFDEFDLNGPEVERQRFKAASRELAERLERAGGGLSELILEYARIAGRPIALD